MGPALHFRRSTQHHLRCFLDIYAVAVVLMFAGSIFLASGALLRTIHGNYLVEMIRRLVYTGSMLEWGGTAEDLLRSKSIFYEYISGIPFNITLTPDIPTDMSTRISGDGSEPDGEWAEGIIGRDWMDLFTEGKGNNSTRRSEISSLWNPSLKPTLGETATNDNNHSSSSSSSSATVGPVQVPKNTFPYTVSYYNPRLQGQVELNEIFRRSPRLGCQVEMLLSGFCFLFLGLVCFYSLVKLGNFLAQRFPSPSRWYWSYGAVTIGFLFPLLSWVAMVFFLKNISEQCLRRSMSDDIGRTAELYGTVFSLLSFGYGLNGLEYFSPTMNTMNEKFIQDRNYGVSSVSNLEKNTDLFPPLPFLSSTILTTIADHNGELASFSGYFLPDRTFLGTYSIPAVNGLLVVGHKDVDSVITIHSRIALLEFCMFFAPLVIVTAVVWFFFPFPTLGLTAPVDPQQKATFFHLGPWGWRASPYWPYWKTMEVALFLSAAVGGLFVFVSEFSRFLYLSDTFVSDFAYGKEVFDGLLHVGKSNFENIAKLISSFIWYPLYLELLVLERGVNRVDFSAFYDRMASELKKTKYEGISNAHYLREQPFDGYPLLENTELYHLMYEKISSEDATEIGYKGVFLTQVWDSLYMRAVLTNDDLTLSNGDEDVSTDLFETAQALDIGVSEFFEYLRVALNAGEIIANIANDYNNQPESNIAALWASDLGREVAKEENEIIKDNSISLSFFQVYYYFLWNWFPTFSPMLACLLVAGVLLILDIYYVVLFFGYEDWSFVMSSVGRRKNIRTTRIVPSNDYTASSAFVPVNRCFLWRSAHWLSLCVLAITVIAVALLVSSYSLTHSASGSLLHHLETTLLFRKDEADEVFRGSYIPYTAALWLRSFLSVLPADIDKSIETTAIWADLSRVTYVSGSVPHRKYRNPEDYQAAAVIKHITFLISIKEFGSGEDQKTRVYKDFAALLGLLDTFFAYSEAPNCLMGEELTNFSGQLVEFMRGLVEGNTSRSTAAVTAMEPTMTEHSGNCGISEGLETYLHRLISLSNLVEWFGTRETVTEALSEEIRHLPDLNASLRVKNIYATATRTQALTILSFLPVGLGWIGLPFLIIGFMKAKLILSCIYYG